MTRRVIPQILAVVLALCAAFVCLHLLHKHVTGSAGPAWFEAGCSAESGADSGPNCAAVLASPWSYWPPRVEGDPPNKPRTPVALMGVIYYGVLAVWFIGIGRPSSSRRWVLAFPVVFMLFGLGSSTFFVYIMFSKLNAWCPWCMVTHGINALLAVCLLLMIPRRKDTPSVAGATDATDATPAPSHQTRHPGWRLGMATAIGMVLVVFASDQLYGRIRVQKSRANEQATLLRYRAELEKIQQDGELLLTKFLSGEVKQVERRRDDPYRKLGRSPNEPLKIVIFSDFECPACKKLTDFLDHEAQQLFGGALATVFKYFPLDQACNPTSARSVHPHACEAARMAEAARQLGGNDAFWDVHDYLFENQHALKQGKISETAVAEIIGVDVDTLKGKMTSAEVTQRIEEDITDARELGVGSTPSCIIYGRHVGVLYMREINFWDKLANYYWQNRQEPRPEETKRQPLDVTPDNPDPKDAP